MNLNNVNTYNNDFLTNLVILNVDELNTNSVTNSEFNSLEGIRTDITIQDQIDGITAGTGIVGPIGPQGVQGPQGIQGIQGNIGSQGPQGHTGSQGHTGPQGSIGPQGTQGIQGIQGNLGPQGQQGNIGSQGPQGQQGSKGDAGYGVEGFWINAYSMVEQSIINPNDVVEMTYQYYSGNGIIIDPSYSSRIVFQNQGVYNIQFSAQYDKTDSGQDPVYIWFRKNGVDIPDSNTEIHLEHNNSTYLAAWNFILDLSSNDYIEIVWSTPDIDMRLLAQVGSSMPDIPSVIMTAQSIAYVSTGATGPQGGQGPVGDGFTWKGEYSDGVNYSPYDVVSYDNNSYVCILACINTLPSSTAYWQIMLKGFIWRGAYSGSTNYIFNDVVSYNGSSYICILDSYNNTPTNTTYWNLLAQKGDTGDQGPKGSKGDTGDTGAKGDKGEKGDQGPAGDSTAATIAAATAGAAAVAASAAAVASAASAAAAAASAAEATAAAAADGLRIEALEIKTQFQTLSGATTKFAGDGIAVTSGIVSNIELNADGTSVFYGDLSVRDINGVKVKLNNSGTITCEDINNSGTITTLNESVTGTATIEELDASSFKSGINFKNGTSYKSASIGYAAPGLNPTFSDNLGSLYLNAGTLDVGTSATTINIGTTSNTFLDMGTSGSSVVINGATITAGGTTSISYLKGSSVYLGQNGGLVTIAGNGISIGGGITNTSYVTIGALATYVTGTFYVNGIPVYGGGAQSNGFFNQFA